MRWMKQKTVTNHDELCAKIAKLAQALFIFLDWTIWTLLHCGQSWSKSWACFDLCWASV